MTTRMFRHAQSQDQADILELWNARLGDAYADATRVQAAVDEHSRTLCIVARGGRESGDGCDGGRLQGFVIGRVLSRKQARRHCSLDSGYAIDAEVGLLDVICVADWAEGKGLGTELTRRCVSALSELGVEQTLCVSWLRDGTVDSSTLLESLEFTHLTTNEAHWKEESLAQGYDCPDCTEPPCTCDAGIYAYET